MVSKASAVLLIMTPKDLIRGKGLTHAVVSIQDGWLAGAPSAAKERCLDYFYH